MLAKDTFGRFFEPKSIMIVGASRTSGKAGNIILENIIANGYQGKVFPINPSAEEILGIKCFPSIADAPEVPDLTVLAVPAAATLETILQCAEKNQQR
jgi:acyl-CoA synthetase (NDP forming)